MSPNTTPNPKDSALNLSATQKEDWLSFRSSSATVTFSKEEMNLMLSMLSLSGPAFDSIKEKLQEAANPGNRERDIFVLAKQQSQQEGETEFDDNCIISEGEDNGAYVGSFTWVGFRGTKLDNNEKLVYIAMSSQGFWSLSNGWVDDSLEATNFESKEDALKFAPIASESISCIIPLEMSFNIEENEMASYISIKELIEYISSSIRSHGVIDRADALRDALVIDIFKDYFIDEDDLLKIASPALIDLYNREVDCEENVRAWRSGSFERVEVNR